MLETKFRDNSLLWDLVAKCLPFMCTKMSSEIIVKCFLPRYLLKKAWYYKRRKKKGKKGKAVTGGRTVWDALIEPSQLTFTCSNSTIKTLEKGVKYVQNQQ